ncbi:MAG: PKD domain-containing protein [Flavobacteriales bacterium]
MNRTCHMGSLWKRALPFLILFFIGPGLLSGQTYLMQDGSDTTCSGSFYDSGGGASTYGNNETFVYTLCPNNSGDIEVEFPMFDVEGGFDELCIYDGPTTGATQLGCFSNNNSLLGQTISATNSNSSGCLTFEFTSDGSVTLDGWEANVSCAYPCQVVDPVIDSVDPGVNSSSGYVEICPGDQVTFWGDANYPNNDSLYHQANSTSTFVWNWGDGTSDTGQVVSRPYNSAGIYEVSLTVIDSNGCVSGAPASQTVMVAPEPSFDGTGPVLDSICLGGTNSLIGTVSPDTIYETCTPPVADTTALPDGNGVSYTSAITVDCYNSGQTLNDISNLENICLTMEHSYLGDLQLEITCPSGQTVMLADTYNGSPTSEYLGEPIDNNTGTPGDGYQYCFNTSPSYGTWNAEAGNYTYTYTDNNGNTITNDYLPAGSYQSENPLSNLVGCQLNGDWTITVTDNLGIDDGYIFNWGLTFNDSILPPNLQDAVGMDSTYWNNDPDVVSMSSNQDTAVVQPDSTGQQCYTYTAVDSFGCAWDTTVCFYVNTLNISVSSDTTICQGGSATLSASATGGSSPYTFYWDNGLGTGATKTVSPGSTTTYSVYAEDASGCVSDTLSIQVNLYPPLQVNASAQGPALCPGDSVQLVAVGSGGIDSGFSYNWSNGMTGDTITITPDSSKTLSVSLEDTCETPTATDSVSVVMGSPPSPQIVGNNLEGCGSVTPALVNDTTNMVAGSDCSWELGDGSTATGCDTIFHQYDEPGCYDVQLTVETPAGCVDSVTEDDYVCVHPIPDAQFGFQPQETTYLHPEIDFTNQSIGDSTIFWDFGGLDSSTIQNPSYVFPEEEAGTYDVCLTATSSEGCKDTVCKEVVVKGKFFLYVPNAFTPDGDGINDLFRPVINGMDRSDYRFEIYDRWGKLVFKTKDPEKGWDGSIDGNKDASKTDVYVWKVITTNKYTGNSIVETGHVTLLR